MADPWHPFSAFQVYADHVPMGGFRLVARLCPDPATVLRTVGARAHLATAIDPELGQALIRAGVGLAQASGVAFVYSNTQEVVVLLEPNIVTEVGQSLQMHDHLVSRMAARLARIVGVEVPIEGTLYEFPNVAVVRKAMASTLDAHEEATPKRAAAFVGAQMVGRGEGFHPSLIESIEEQHQLLQQNGVELEQLPNWWWRGIAARATPESVELFDDLATGEALSALVPG